MIRANQMHSFLKFPAQTWSRLSLFRLLATPTRGDIELRQSYLPVEQEKPLGRLKLMSVAKRSTKTEDKESQEQTEPVYFLYLWSLE